MENFKVIIVEDVPLELKGTEGIFKNDIPEAEIIGTADSETAYWKLMKQQKPDLVLLDLGLGGSTTVGVEICRSTKEQYPDVKVLIFTGEILNEKLWVDVLDAGCDGIILKSGELLTRGDVASCMAGKKLVFTMPHRHRSEEHTIQAKREQPTDAPGGACQLRDRRIRRAISSPSCPGLHQGANHQSPRDAFRRKEPGEKTERTGAEALPRRQQWL